MAPERSTPEEIPHVSTLALSTLEALLGQQEECSRTILQSALAKKQDAKRLIAQASRAEGEVKSLHVRYEQTEAAIRALRTLVAEKNGQILEGRFEDTNRSRTLGKRSGSSDQMSDPARKRVAGGMAIELEPSDDEYIPSDDYAGASGHRFSTFVLRTKANNAILPRHGATPRETFAHTFEYHPLRYSNHTTGMTRMVRYDNPDEILIYISGQKVVKGEKVKRAGCAVVYETEHPFITPNPLVFSLEKTGVNGAKQSCSTYCATLRAVVAALELKTWASEGWKQVTIATDSSAIHHAITAKLAKWVAKDWLKWRSVHRPAHPELWARALDLINEQAYHGCEVRFLLITEKQNQHAVYLASTIARSDLVSEEYQPCDDVGFTFRGAL